MKVGRVIFKGVLGRSLSTMTWIELGISDILYIYGRVGDMVRMGDMDRLVHRYWARGGVYGIFLEI